MFAGLTVIIALLGMLAIGLSFISGLGIGAAAVVAVTVARRGHAVARDARLRQRSRACAEPPMRENRKIPRPPWLLIADGPLREHKAVRRCTSVGSRIVP